MTLKTGIAFIDITAYTFMLLIGFDLFVTGNTGKYRIIARIYVAIGTRTPFIFMTTTEDREVLAVMVPICGHPPWV